jgi:hypothetical protein
MFWRSFNLMESLGAERINPVRDLQVPMLAALRAVVSVPIDVHTDNPPGSGGFIRVYEAPEIVRVAAPVQTLPAVDSPRRRRQAAWSSHTRNTRHRLPRMARRLPVTMACWFSPILFRFILSRFSRRVASFAGSSSHFGRGGSKLVPKQNPEEAGEDGAGGRRES